MVSQVGVLNERMDGEVVLQNGNGLIFWFHALPIRFIGSERTIYVG